MLGAMAAQPKVRKVAQRQQRTKLGVLEKPKEVKNINTEDKQARLLLVLSLSSSRCLCQTAVSPANPGTVAHSECWHPCC